MAEFHDDAQKKADEDAVAKGVCPECGQSLDGKDVRNHLQMEFPRWQEPGMDRTDYGRRARMLDALATHREEQKKSDGAH